MASMLSSKRYSNKSRGRDETLANGHRGHFLKLASALAGTGKDFYSRGWVMGTGGNFSCVLSHSPLRLAITPTSADKGALKASDILEINESGEVLRGNSRPSFEYMLHLGIARARNAGAILHTHSIWATVLSGRQAAHHGFNIEGYEMLKGLEGIKTHQHQEWVPILANSQDMVQLASEVESMLKSNPGVHGFLLQQHGLYTWGETLREARRHVEIFEFLFEVMGRTDRSNHHALEV